MSTLSFLSFSSSLPLSVLLLISCIIYLVSSIYLLGLPEWLKRVNNPPTVSGFHPWVGKTPLEEEMATHSSILAWEIPWMEEPGGLQSKGSQKSQTRLSDQTIYLVSIFYLSPLYVYQSCLSTHSSIHPSINLSTCQSTVYIYLCIYNLSI